MTYRSIALILVLAILLISWGLAEVLGWWVWPLTWGLALLAVPGLRPLGIVLFYGVRHFAGEEPTDVRSESQP